MKLREYQNNIAIQAGNKLMAFGCCYLSMECRTGKTLTALYAADKFNAKSVLFISQAKQAYTGDKNHLRRFARALFVRYTFTRKLFTTVSPILGMQQITVEKL